MIRTLSIRLSGTLSYRTIQTQCVVFQFLSCCVPDSMTDTAIPALTFTGDELDTFARTADALSAYLGKPVLVEIIDASETGFEWALFAIPLGIEEDDTEVTVVQVGGAKARLLGSQGGLNTADETYTCRFLWAIQLSDVEGVRFIKIDDQGEDVAWSNELTEVLPFDLEGDVLADEVDDLLLNELDADFPTPTRRTLH